jgi:hypothetical protein
MVVTAIPLAKQIAARYFWNTQMPQVTRQRDRKRRKDSKTVFLPDTETLHPQPVARSAQGIPLHSAPLDPDCFSPVAQSDTLEEIIRTIHRLGLTSKGKKCDEVRPAWDAMKRPLRLGLYHDDFDEGEAYIRDRRMDLSSTPRPLHYPEDASASSYRCEIFPYLQQSPTEEDPLLGNGNEMSYLGLQFERSVLVPLGIKPPSAGVITDKNLHRGLYFLSHAAPQQNNYEHWQTLRKEYFVTKSEGGLLANIVSGGAEGESDPLTP